MRDLNDFDTLRHDPLLQTVTGRIEPDVGQRADFVSF